MSLSGSCLCGQINLTISSEPMMAGVCHCKNCQKQTGSAFSTLAGFPLSDIDFGDSELSMYEDSATESGSVVKRFFAENADRRFIHKYLLNQIRLTLKRAFLMTLPHSSPCLIFGTIASKIG